MTTIHRSAIVPYSAHAMYALVADIGTYHEFLPWCGGARVLSSKDGEVIAAIDIAYKGLHKSFTTRNHLQADKIIEMRLLDGPFSHLHGVWQFAALDEQASKISLDMEFGVANRILSLAITPVFTTISNQLVDSFRQRADALYGKKR
jgi:ribosome-associated toxin RatA of RatAB toxin-antitoxin module